MLQRQIMFKQLKELQQNQQLQDLGDSRNQEYMNQLASLKQASAVQFGSNVNGEPLCDPQVHALENMQMMQQGGANVYQGFPTGFPGQNRGQGLSTTQFDVSGYGSLASNSDRNLNLYSQFQGLSNQSDNMLAKNNYKIHGTSGINPSGFASSFGSQQANYASDQISIGDGALLPNQMFQENNLFGQVPVQSLNNDIFSYANQRIRMQRDEDNSWHGASTLRASNMTPIPDADASLDPLERKILYETDDDSLGLLFGGSQFGKGDFNGKMGNVSHGDKFQSSQSGIWSALMQSAVAEEDWGGLNFHNQDQPTDNTQLTVTKNEKHQNVWVDRNLHHASSQSPELQKSEVNYGFPGLPLSDHQYHKQDEELQPNSSHALSRQFQSKHAAGGPQLFQSIPASNGLPFQCDDAKGTLWSQGGTSISASSGRQDTFDQGNHMNANRFSVESHKLVSGGNEEPMSTTFLASLVSHGQHMNTQRRMGEVLNKDEIQNDIMQLNSRSSYSAMGNSGGASIQNAYANDYIKNSSSQNYMEAKFPGHTVSSQATFKPSGASADSQHGLTLTGPPTSSPHISSQQELSSPKAHKFPSNFFRPNDSSSSHLEINSASPNGHSSEKESSLNPFRMHNLIRVSSSVSQHPYQQADKKDIEALAIPSGKISALGCSYDVNNQQTLATEVISHDAVMGGGHNERSPPAETQEDQLDKVSASAEVPIFQQGEMLRQTESHSHSTSMNETSNGAFPSQVSLQEAPSWFKNHGTLNNSRPLSQLGTGNLQENDATVQGNPAISGQGNGVCPASSSSVLDGLLPLKNLPSVDASSQSLDVSVAKKRKIVAFESIPWHKEVNNGAPRLQNISMQELEWAQASKTKLEEVKYEAEIMDEQPVVQAKRRLVLTTLLTQQILRPAPAAILSADANSICDSVVYFASRLVLGGLCNLKSKPPSDADDSLIGKPKTPGRTSDSDISKIVGGLASKVKKIEADLSRLEKSVLMIDVKAENQDLEKLAVINRFARFHSRPYQSPIDQASSSGPKPPPPLQRYISASPMPKVIPDELECLSL